jgi:hypothetical protein
MDRLTAVKWVLAGIAVVCSATAVEANADAIDEIVDALKPSPLDYAIWAQGVLKAADDLADAPATQQRIYEKAYELGLKRSTGYATSVQAARAALTGAGDQKLAWQMKLLVALRLTWQSAARNAKGQAGQAYIEHLLAVADEQAEADNTAEAVKLYTEASSRVRYCAPDRREEVAAKLRDATARHRVLLRAEQLKRQLAETPNDAGARENLVRLYVVDLDRPAEAATLLTADLGEAWRTYVPLAAKDVEQLDKQPCRELGDWYMSVAPRPASPGRRNTLARAVAYYQRFVDLETSSLQKMVVKARLDAATKELEKLAGGSGTKLLYSQDFSKPESIRDFEFPNDLMWKRLATGGKGGPADGCLDTSGPGAYRPKLPLPRTIALLSDRVFGDFVLEADLMYTGREYNQSDMCIFFGFNGPTRYYFCHLAPVPSPKAHAVHVVKDRPYARVPQKTIRPAPWKAGTWHKVRLTRTVADGMIKVYFDDMSTPIIIAKDRTYTSGYIGFGSYDDRGRIDNIKIWGPKMTRKNSAFYKKKTP